jgi:putative transposase
LTDKQKKIALAKSDFLRIYLSSTESSKNKVKAKLDFIEAYNSGCFIELFKIIGKVTYKSVERWKVTLHINNNDPFSLAPGYKYIKNRSITPEQSEILLKQFLNQNKPPKREAIRLAKNIMCIKGISDNLSYSTYERYLNDWIKNNYALYISAREGGKALNDLVIPDLKRDMSLVEVGDVVFADGKIFDFEMINPFTGRPKRMTLIMFVDMKSMLPLGFDIMPSENALTIASALRKTLLFLGFRPRIIYIDNGRAFGAKYFHSKIETSGIAGLFERLEIKVKFSEPYHGQTKSQQERFHGIMAEYERQMPSYIGNSIDNKPARLRRNEKLYQGFYNKLTGGTVPTVKDVYRSLPQWFQTYASREHQSGNFKGRAPIDIFSESIEKVKSLDDYSSRIISPEELNYLMLSEENRTITKNGIRFLDSYYFDWSLGNIRDKVTIKYDLLDTSYILVYDKNGQFICKALDTSKYHPAAKELGTDEDIEKVQKALKERASFKKGVIEDTKALYSDENVLEMRKYLPYKPEQEQHSSDDHEDDPEDASAFRKQGHHGSCPQES